MVTAPLPLSLAPVGEEGQKYRMIWERDSLEVDFSGIKGGI